MCCPGATSQWRTTRVPNLILPFPFLFFAFWPLHDFCGLPCTLSVSWANSSWSCDEGKEKESTLLKVPPRSSVPLLLLMLLLLLFFWSWMWRQSEVALKRNLPVSWGQREPFSDLFVPHRGHQLWPSNRIYRDAPCSFLGFLSFTREDLWI